MTRRRAFVVSVLLVGSGCAGDETADNELTTVDSAADLVAAEALIDAWQAEGLPLGEVRDNTDKWCVPPAEYGCTVLLTTDYVSIRVFVEPQDAADWVVWQDTNVVGRFNASFGGDSDVWPFDTAPYIDIMESVIDP